MSPGRLRKNLSKRCHSERIEESRPEDKAVRDSSSPTSPRNNTGSYRKLLSDTSSHSWAPDHPRSRRPGNRRSRQPEFPAARRPIRAPKRCFLRLLWRFSRSNMRAICAICF